MDDDLVTFGADEDDEFEEVAGGVGSQDEPPVWVLAEVVDDQRVLDSVEHVFLGDIVAMRRVVDLHTRLAYYENRMPGVRRPQRAELEIVSGSPLTDASIDRTDQRNFFCSSDADSRTWRPSSPSCWSSLPP